MKTYSTEVLSEITEHAKNLLSVTEIALIVDKTEAEFINDLETIPKVKKALVKGYLLQKSLINKSILKEAEQGSVPAQKDALKMLKNIENEY